MRRKIIATGIISIVTAAAVSGCGSSSADEGGSANKPAASSDNANSAASSEPIKLTFASWTSGEAATKDAMEAMAKKYHETHPNVTIEYQTVPFNNIKEQTFVWAASGQAPDIIQTFTATFPSYATSDIIVPLDDLLGKEYTDDLLPSLKADYSYNGKLMGVPWAVTPYILYWNKELFQKAGLEAKPPKTLNDMLDIARKLSKLKTDKGEQVYGLGEPTDKLPINGMIALRNLYGFKGSIMDKDGKVSVNTPQMQDTLKYYQDLNNEGLIPQSAKLKDLRNLFSIGRLGMYFDGYYGKNVFRDLSGKGADFDKTWGAALVPANQSGDSLSISEAHGLVISKDSKHKEAAADFIKFLTGADMMTYYHKTNDILPARKSISQLPAFNSNDFDKTLIEQLSHLQPLPQNKAGLEQTYLEMADSIQRVTVGKQDPAKVAGDLNTKLNQLLK